MKKLSTLFSINLSSMLLSIIALLFVFINSAYAGTSEIKWTEPDKYTDIRAGNEHRVRFKERIFKAFEEHFLALSAALPEGQLLKVDVTNVDLAGDVRFSTIDHIRVIKDLYIPRMTFSYQLLNADKLVLQSDDVALKDMGFRIGINLRYKNKTIPYEKRMLDKWFNSTFINNTKQ